MNVKLIDLNGRGGKWYQVQNADTGEVVGEIMNVMASLNRIIGWTFKKFDDGPCKMRRTYKTGKDALNALVKAFNA